MAYHFYILEFSSSLADLGLTSVFDYFFVLLRFIISFPFLNDAYFSELN